MRYDSESAANTFNQQRVPVPALTPTTGLGLEADPPALWVQQLGELGVHP